MSSQSQDIVQHLTKRIEILLDEVEQLTDVVNSNAQDQTELLDKYNQLLNVNQESQKQLKLTEDKLAQILRTNLQANLEKLHDDKQAINQLLSDSGQTGLQGPQHPLYQLCQEKINQEQQLRLALNELEQQNAVLHSENARLRSFIQHDRMFQQLEQLAGRQTVLQQQPIQQTPYLLSTQPHYPPQYLPQQPQYPTYQQQQVYQQPKFSATSRDALSQRENSPQKEPQLYQYQHQQQQSKHDRGEHENLVIQNNNPIHITIAGAGQDINDLQKQKQYKDSPAASNETPQKKKTFSKPNNKPAVNKSIRR